MKRLLPMLLLFCLLLTACSPVTSPTEPSATADPTTEAPTETEATAPTETQPPQLTVHADFSQYTPQIPVEAKYTRLSDDSLEDLLPTDTPTRIFPFPGEPLVDEYGGLYISVNRFKYGIIDETGCILADPVYSAVSLLTVSDTWETLPFWILEKTYAAAAMWEGSEYMESETLCAFASIDGTFVSDCIYGSIVAYEDRILAFYPTDAEDRIRFDVYNTEGTFLFSSHELSFAEEIGGGPYQFSYAEGLYVIAFGERTYAPEGYYFAEYTYYYMDEYGNLLLGPYYDASPFSLGKAAVRLTEDGGYVFINKDGTVLSGEYNSYKFLSNGNIIVPREDSPPQTNHHDLLGPDLEYINFLPGYYYVTEDGYINVYDSFNNEYCYTPEGEQLWRRSNAHFLSSALCQYNTEEGTILENMVTGKTRELPRDCYCNLIGHPTDPIIAIHTYGYDEPQPILFLNQDLEELDITVYSYEYMGYYEIGSSRLSAICLQENGRSTVYMVSDTPFATYPVTDCRMSYLYPDQFVSLTTPDCTYLYSPDGELLFAYPINPMDD